LSKIRVISLHKISDIEKNKIIYI